MLFEASQKRATEIPLISKRTHCKLSYKWTTLDTATRPHAKKNLLYAKKTDKQKIGFPMDLLYLLNYMTQNMLQGKLFFSFDSHTIFMQLVERSIM